MTQVDWADAIAVSVRAITKWENGKAEPHPVFVQKMEALVSELGGDE